MKEIIWALIWAAVGALLYRLISSIPSSPPADSSSVHVSRLDGETSSRQAGETISPALVTGNYEVFLNFRGADVRKRFASVVYNMLNDKSIRTFFDEKELGKGKEIDPALKEYIKGSKIFIPIFSPTYASTSAPLMELGHMMECYDEEEGRVIFPIFYMVTVADMKHQRGPFKDIFRKLAKKYSAEKVAKWKADLQRVGEINGWVVDESSSEGDIAAQVSEKVRKILNANYKLFTGQLLDIDSRVEEVRELLSKHKKVVVIQGMSGIGKTSLAEAVYNSVSALFKQRCIVYNVRDIFLGKDPIVTLQNKILSGILGGDTKVTDPSEGISVFQNRVWPQSNTLIVLDDIDREFEFKKTFGYLEDFPRESRIIITTIDKRVYERYSDDDAELCQPKEMKPNIALQLFTRSAFGPASTAPPPGYSSLIQGFLRLAEGNPFAVKAMGSQLFRKPIGIWEATLKKLQAKPADSRWKIFFDDLDPDEKHIFLDIACHFIGEGYDRPFYFWEASGKNPLLALENLELKAMIKVDESNQYWMHEQYKILGRSIVVKEDENPWKRSRIWSEDEVLDMLKNNKGNDKVKILKVNMEGQKFELTPDKVEKLSQLKYLEVRYGSFAGSFKHILPNLLWLQLNRGQLSNSVDFSMKKLVILDLAWEDLTDDWGGWNEFKEAENLRFVNLNIVDGLETAPNLSRCQSLEHLDLSWCWSMGGELHVGNFQKLKVLSISLTKISKLTGGCEKLINLQKLEAGTRCLEEVPADMGLCSSLEYLDLRNTKLEQLPRLPSGLKELHVSSPIPNLLELKDLEVLEFYHCKNLEIPGDIRMLSKLKTLQVYSCRCEHLLGRTALAADRPLLPPSLNKLRIYFCDSLEKLPDLSNLSSLTSVTLINVGVDKIDGLGELTMLDILDIDVAPKLVHLSGIERLTRLKRLCLGRCDVLRSLPSLSELTQLTHLKIKGCPIFPQIIISGLKLAKLEELDLGFPGTDPDHCPSYLDLSGVQGIKQLYLTGCKHLGKIRGFNTLEHLQWLKLRQCEPMEELDLSPMKHLFLFEVDGSAEPIKNYQKNIPYTADDTAE